MFNAGYEMRIGLKTTYIEYEDIDRPFRSHVLLASEDRIMNTTVEQGLMYHRNEFNRQDAYE